MKKLIIRADDLGLCNSVNEGIAKAVNQGVVTSVGLMTNMPESKKGYTLLNKEVCLGLHTNICIGKPLSKDVKSLIDDNGVFKRSKEYRTTQNDFVAYKDVYKELKAQYQRFIEITGKEPDYIDAHAVVSETYIKALKQLSLETGIKYSDFPKKWGIIRINEVEVYCMMNLSYQNQTPFDTIIKSVNSINKEDVLMIVTHPGNIDEELKTISSLTIQRKQELELLTSKEIEDYICRNDVKLISYNDIILENNNGEKQ